MFGFFKTFSQWQKKRKELRVFVQAHLNDVTFVNGVVGFGTINEVLNPYDIDLCGEDRKQEQENYWECINPMNIPGPFYGADTDTCSTGLLEARHNILSDNNSGQEFVYRQPRNIDEIYHIRNAADVETVAESVHLG